MTNSEQYLNYLLGSGGIKKMPKPDQSALNQLPNFLRLGYEFSWYDLSGNLFVLAQPLPGHTWTTEQLATHQPILAKAFGCPVAFEVLHLQPSQRERLIKKQIPFVVPGNQLFLPQFLIYLQEKFPLFRQPQQHLSPSAQAIVIYYLLHHDLAAHPMTFGDWATKLGYSNMAIGQAAQILTSKNICRIEQRGKEKHLQFSQEKSALWAMVEPDLHSPVIKKTFVEEIPNAPCLFSNATALATYTQLNASKQVYLAIFKNDYHRLKSNHTLVGENDMEGAFCLEIWSYRPSYMVAGQHDTQDRYVDPLSLYLSLRDQQDERLEMELESLIKRMIW